MPANDNYLPYDVRVLEAELASLLAAYPELADDEDQSPGDDQPERHEYQQRQQIAVEMHGVVRAFEATEPVLLETEKAGADQHQGRGELHIGLHALRGHDFLPGDEIELRPAKCNAGLPRETGAGSGVSRLRKA